MNPPSRKLSDETQQLVKEFLEKGNIVTKCPPDKRSENIEFTFSYGNNRKTKKEPDTEVDPDVEVE
jgi:hypothetical protein